MPPILPFIVFFSFSVAESPRWDLSWINQFNEVKPFDYKFPGILCRVGGNPLQNGVCWGMRFHSLCTSWPLAGGFIQVEIFDQIWPQNDGAPGFAESLRIKLAFIIRRWLRPPPPPYPSDGRTDEAAVSGFSGRANPVAAFQDFPAAAQIWAKLKSPAVARPPPLFIRFGGQLEWRWPFIKLNWLLQFI